MRGLRPLLRGLALGLMLAPGALAESVQIPLAEAREGLARARSEGRADLQWHLARGLVAADPRDYAAQVALADAALRLGRPQEAEAPARAAQSLARTPAQTFETRLLRARLAEAHGGTLGPMAAQAWTRAALDHAPHPVHRDMALSELHRMRRDAPLQLQFNFTMAPSSNVNNGSRESLIELPGWGGLLWQLSPLSQALAGWYAEAGLTARLRLAEGTSSATHLRFSALHRDVTLSAGARAAVNTWRAQQIAAGASPPDMPDYDFSTVELGLQHARSFGQTAVSLGATLGHSWFGGADLGDSLRLDLQAQRGLRPDLGVFGGITLDRQWRKAPGQDSTTTGLNTGVVRQLASGDRLRLTLGGRAAAADSVDLRHDALSLRLGWEKAVAVAGMRLDASVGLEERRYDPGMLAPAGRRDLRLDAGVSVAFERLERMGFLPVMTLTASRNRSNVRLYQGRDAGVSFGIRSAF